MNIRDRVRSVFLSPSDFYSMSEAAELLGWSLAETSAALEHGDLEGERSCSGYRIAWQEVAAMITAQYPQALIEEALGDQVASVIPEIVRLAELRVEIPRYEVVMLSKLAERENVTVDEFLSRHLLDLAGAEVEWLNGAIPEFATAMRWPEA
jgi:hypothetical protein